MRTRFVWARGQQEYHSNVLISMGLVNSELSARTSDPFAFPRFHGTPPSFLAAYRLDVVSAYSRAPLLKFPTLDFLGRPIREGLSAIFDAPKAG